MSKEDRVALRRRIREGREDLRRRLREEFGRVDFKALRARAREAHLAQAGQKGAKKPSAEQVQEALTQLKRNPG